MMYLPLWTSGQEPDGVVGTTLLVQTRSLLDDYYEEIVYYA
jgi:hypothetical protein